MELKGFEYRYKDYAYSCDVLKYLILETRTDRKYLLFFTCGSVYEFDITEKVEELCSKLNEMNIVEWNDKKYDSPMEFFPGFSWQLKISTSDMYVSCEGWHNYPDNWNSFLNILKGIGVNLNSNGEDSRKPGWKKLKTAQFHLPGLFEFYEFYEAFLPLFYEHREYFYDWAKIGSIYGAPADCLWSGGRIGLGENNAEEVLELLRKYNISARLTFSNSLLQEEHLSNKKCNRLCALFEKYNGIKNGVIVHSDLLLEYLKNKYPGLYYVSSTTKVITDFDEFNKELERIEFEYVVPDFRLNKQLEKLNNLSQNKKDKVEFLCNECCYFGCTDRKECYENVSRKMLENDVPNHICKAPEAMEGYVFSKAMKNPGFISNQDIVNTYLPNGFTNFKIEGRGLGSALLLEFLLYYMTKPEFQLQVREAIYLDSDLDLF